MFLRGAPHAPHRQHNPRHRQFSQNNWLWPLCTLTAATLSPQGNPHSPLTGTHSCAGGVAVCDGQRPPELGRLDSRLQLIWALTQDTEGPRMRNCPPSTLSPSPNHHRSV